MPSPHPGVPFFSSPLMPCLLRFPFSAALCGCAGVLRVAGGGAGVGQGQLEHADPDTRWQTTGLPPMARCRYHRCVQIQRLSQCTYQNGNTKRQTIKNGAMHIQRMTSYGSTSDGPMQTPQVYAGHLTLFSIPCFVSHDIPSRPSLCLPQNH